MSQISKTAQFHTFDGHHTVFMCHICCLPRCSRYLILLKKQRAIDEREVAGLQAECARFLECAVRHYSRCLAAARSSRHDLRIFRLAALWFDNATGAGSDAINAMIRVCGDFQLLYIMSRRCLS